MNPLFAGAAEVQDYCRERGWGFCIIGGLVVLRWSGHRETKDVDLLIVTPFGEEAAIIDGLYERFEARFDDPREKSLHNRVVQFTTSNGCTIDGALGNSRRLLRIVSRASLWEVDGFQLLTCSAEDLVVNKALSGRPKDWSDVEEIVAKQGAALDTDLVMREFAPVLRQGHHLTDPLAQLQRDNHHEAMGVLEKLLRKETTP